MKKNELIENIYVVIEDENGNFHQGALKQVDEMVIKGLVKVYPNNNFTKKFTDKMKRILR